MSKINYHHIASRSYKFSPPDIIKAWSTIAPVHNVSSTLLYSGGSTGTTPPEGQNGTLWDHSENTSTEITAASSDCVVQLFISKLVRHKEYLIYNERSVEEI